MRTMVGLLALVFMLVALSSCSGNRLERAFMGTWKGTTDGEPIELSFMEKGIWVVKLPEETSSGTWTVDAEGNARITIEDGKAIATVVNDGTLIAREEDGSSTVVFEKSDPKKK